MAEIPELPPLSRAAFLLDLDGTLLDIAPTPDAVIVPPTLRADLVTLRNHCGGALAIVTGRPIVQIDELLGDVPTAVAGEHGTAIRHLQDGPAVVASQPVVPADWLCAATKIVMNTPGALLEKKTHGFVVHYRAVPEVRDKLQAALDLLLLQQPGVFVLLAAKMAWEIRPAGIDKGCAVVSIMRHEPFVGRLPIYVGDDVTDEAGISAAVTLDGFGLRVPANFVDPASVRRWIARLGKAASNLSL